MGIKRLGFAGLAGATAAALIAAASGCAHAPPPAVEPCTAPEPLRVGLRASPRLNPGEKGEALATVVRLYQLKGTAKLVGASFDDLLDHDRDTLGEDFVGVQEVTINPGDKLDPPAARNPDAAYVAAVALFRQPAATTWRAFKKLPAVNPQHCHATNDKGKSPPAADGAVRFFLDENRVELR
jgi:type VI secretion system VasD/TssJ family lipoprotein